MLEKFILTVLKRHDVNVLLPFRLRIEGHRTTISVTKIGDTLELSTFHLTSPVPRNGNFSPVQNLGPRRRINILERQISTESIEGPNTTPIYCFLISESLSLLFPWL